MVGAGAVLIILAVYALFLVLGELLEKRPLFLKILTWAIVLPYLANTSGWILTEVGRFPWVVYGLVKLDEATSPNVSAGMLLVSLIGYVLIYSILILATIYLLKKYAIAGLETTSESSLTEEGTPLLIAPQD